MHITSLLPSVQLIEKRGTSADALTVLIIGVFHGEEPQGEFVISKYLEKTGNPEQKNHLFYIPCLNPWGKERDLRVNKNGVDLNRNYPTRNWIETEKDENYSGKSAASEEETQVMICLLEEIKPDIILTLHAPLKCVNYDGPAKKLAEQIAVFCDYPVIADLGYPTPGSFGTYCGVERNIPTVTLEYDDKESYDSIYSKTRKIFDWLGKLERIQ